MGRCRVYGRLAIRAHTGRELIRDSLKDRLTDPIQSEKALAKLRQLITPLRPKKGSKAK